jgi:hypothetical protein
MGDARKNRSHVTSFGVGLKGAPDGLPLETPEGAPQDAPWLAHS